MAGFLGEDQVRRVKEASDLVALIGEYTVVQRAGANFRACCPFHQERSPSFYIYTDDQHYHCFGCGVHGDAIRFAMEKENLAFVDAMEFLARRASLELVYEEGRGGQGLARGERQRLLDWLERATAFYERYLWERPEGEPARAYLAERGLDEAICREFRLGWAPGGAALTRAAMKGGASADDLQALDLARERGPHLVDRFHERLMFPICDRFGQPIAFSGRILPAAERAAKEADRHVGKYINSTDTPVYHKGSVVFNLARARARCRERGRLLVMEGPTDVMAAAQAGVPECAAVLGTALTEEHARQLGRVVGEQAILVLAFDGDRAGRENSLKAVRTCLAAGVPVRVVMMPPGVDPAELLGQGEEGQRRLEEVLAQGRPDLAHLLTSAAPRPHELEPAARQRLIDRLLAVLRPVPDDVVRGAYLEQVASYFGLSVEELRLRLDRLAETPRAVARSGTEEVGEPAIEALDELRDSILHLLVRRPELRAQAFDDLGLEPAMYPQEWAELLVRLQTDPDGEAAVLLGTGPDGRPLAGPRAAAVAVWLREQRTRGGDEVAAGEAVLPGLIAELGEQQLARRLADLEHRMQGAQEQGHHDQAADLYREVMALRQGRS